MSLAQPLTDSYWPATLEGEIDDITLGDLLDEGASHHPDRAALVFDEPGAPLRSWTYAELVTETTQAARALLGLFTPGDRVAVWAPNCAEWVLLQHAAARAGLTLVTINPAYRRDEVRYVLEQSRVAGVFHAAEFRCVDLGEVLASAVEGLGEIRVVRPFDTWADLVAGADPTMQLPVVDPRSAAQIQYTSGTTGQPKGVLLHHAGIVNAARFVAQRGGFGDAVVSVNAMPLFHIGGCGVMEMGTFAMGGTYVLLPGFDAGHVLDALERHQGHVTLAVPTMLIGLLEQPGRAQRDLSSVRAIMTGGASAPAELVREVKREFGSLFTISYGQTETCGVMTQTSVDDNEVDQAETIGRALPHAEVKVISTDDGSVLPVGERGEICMRGYQLMLGYWDNPDATGSTVDAEGWLHSGDLGEMDDRGYIRITGRIKEMIIRGGEKIFPREIENVLFEHPAVSDVAVVGVPDPRWGEKVVAVLTTGPGPLPTAQELDVFCRERLARFKVPAEWKSTAALPQTASGKVQKFSLREQLVEDRLADLPTNEGSS